MGRRDDDDELSIWVAEGYAPAFRTAYLILHNRHDAEEAVQDAFLRAWRFRAAVPPGEGVKPWLYRVVVNACYSKLRRDRCRPALDTGVDPAGRGAGGAASAGAASAEVADVGRGPESLAVARDEHRAVLAALDRMPDHLRIVVALRYYAQLSEKEIADVIHRRPGTVKSRLHEARSRLGADPALLALAGQSGLSGGDGLGSRGGLAGGDGLAGRDGLAGGDGLGGGDGPGGLGVEAATS